MAISKSAATLLSAVTTSQTSPAQDSSGDYVQQLYIDIVVVGTPTVAASVQPQWSPDGTNFYNGPTFSTSLAAGTYDTIIDVPATAKSVKAVFVQQTGGTSSTATVQLGQVTSI